MNAAQLLVRCLENEGVDYVFGIPGEENIHIMDALAQSRIRFVTTRHEQGAAFMADVYGRLTGRAGVCLATLGPGATNLITGVADANMDRAPVAIAGSSDDRAQGEPSGPGAGRAVPALHQVQRPGVGTGDRARSGAQSVQAGSDGEAWRELHRGARERRADGGRGSRAAHRAGSGDPARTASQGGADRAPDRRGDCAVGGGRKRRHPPARFRRGGEIRRTVFNLPVATTFMARARCLFSHPLCLGTIGLQARDPLAFGLDGADLVLCIGYDMVEYDPARWNPGRDKRIVHVDSAPAEVDAHYVLAAGVVGDIADALDRIAERVTTKPEGAGKRLHSSLRWCKKLARTRPIR
jgi:acetolactate synthase-1/2/3 large subunit